MKTFSKYFLLVMILISSNVVFSQAGSPLTQDQKIVPDNANILTEATVVPFEKGIQDSTTINRSSVIEIGTGTGYGPYPIFHADWSNYWKNCRTQTIFKAIELGDGPMLITDLQYQFERIAEAPNNFMLNVEIRIIETPDFEFTRGMYHDTAGATLVFSSDNFVPATSTGWGNIIDIVDYAYSGHNSLIIDIIWGTNDYYLTYDYYRTCKTQVGPVRMLLGYGDEQNPPYPPVYRTDSRWFSNIRFYCDSLAVGDLVGTVTSNGMPVYNAVVRVEGVTSTTTNVDGEYIFSNLVPGENNVFCYKYGYNYIETSAVVVADTQVVLDIDITRPIMEVNPLFLQDTLLPEEVFTDFIDIQNVGVGDLSWEAEIIYPPRGNYKINDIDKRKKELQDMKSSPILDDFSSVVTMEKGSCRDVNIPCPYGTVWSNPAVGTDETRWSSVYFPLVQQFNDVPAPFCTITVYGFYHHYQPNDTMEFIVDFYDDGYVPGPMVMSYVCKAVVEETGEIATVANSNPVITFPILFCTVDIPKNYLTDGYVSVLSQMEFYSWSWCNTYEGTGNAFYWDICEWRAMQMRAVCFGDGSGRWLTLNEYEGNVSSGGGIQTVSANLNAEGTQMGEVYTADIVFSAKQNVSQITVPVTMVIGLSTDIENHTAETLTNLYPNPASDLITITSVPSMTHITVTNYVGQVVYTSKLNEATSVELNTSSYQAGIYLVKIDTENSIVTRRVIISR